MQANTQRVCFPSEASHIASTSASRSAGSMSLQQHAGAQGQRGRHPALGAGLLPSTAATKQRGRPRSSSEQPAQEGCVALKQDAG